MLHDIRLSLRLLTKSPGSTGIAVATLGIAIGANTAIFSVLNAALLKLLPVRDPNELVMLTDPNASMVLGGLLPGERSVLGYEEFTQLRDRSKTMSAIPLLEGFDGSFPISVEGFSSTSEEDRYQRAASSVRNTSRP